VLECVINVSEGRRPEVLEAIAESAGLALLDLHADADHNRSVLTIAGPAAMVMDAARAVATATVEAIDIGTHLGAHPRTGAVDVVPFVPWVGSTMADAVAARDAFAAWMPDALAVPCRTYGPDGPSLPELRSSLRDVSGHPQRLRLESVFPPLRTKREAAHRARTRPLPPPRALTFHRE